jgi:hypothetical protein
MEEKHVENSMTILQLPDEITLIIFESLDAQDLSIVSQVCKKWSSEASEDYLWQKLYLKKWKEKLESRHKLKGESEKPSQSWKDLYIQKLPTDLNWKQQKYVIKSLSEPMGLKTTIVESFQITGNYFITSHRNGTVKIWDKDDLRLL